MCHYLKRFPPVACSVKMSIVGHDQERTAQKELVTTSIGRAFSWLADHSNETVRTAVTVASR
jgi:hypothetical protein